LLEDTSHVSSPIVVSTCSRIHATLLAPSSPSKSFLVSYDGVQASEEKLSRTMRLIIPCDCIPSCISGLNKKR
jgi:hypothetical protein